MKIKDDLHHLIDEIDDEKLLEAYYNLIQNLKVNQAGNLLTRLNDIEKQDLIIAYNESFDKANLLSHVAVKAQHEKWLRK